MFRWQIGLVGLLLLLTNFSFSQSSRVYIFGHSLLDHRPPLIPTPQDETTIPHWLYLLSQAANRSFAADGQYGFLGQHVNLPPQAQWGYDIVPGIWNSDTDPFAAADFTEVLITAANFIQYQPPTELLWMSTYTPITATTTIADWLHTQEPNVRIYIYENWPDMASYGFPPPPSALQNYYAETLGSFHDWWIEYHDSLLAARPALDIRMIPVGPILAKLFTETHLAKVPADTLYEDDAPHGRASLYFLASMITYMGMYEELTPLEFTVPAIVDTSISNHYQEIANFIWEELQLFNVPSGASRVFFEDVSTKITDLDLENDCITLFPNPTPGYLQYKGDLSAYNIEVFDSGQAKIYQLPNRNYTNVNLSGLPSGLYFLRLTHQVTGDLCLQKIVKQ